MKGIFLEVAWYIPVLFKFLFGNVLTPVIVKKLCQGSYLPRKIAVQFLFCATISFGVALNFGHLEVRQMTLLIVVIGFANAWAVYASWQAQAINLSKMSLFIWLQPAIAMVLSSIFLGEHHYLSTMLIIGIVLNFSAIILTSYSDFRTSQANKSAEAENEEKSRENRRFYKAVMIYSGIWGIANFLQKYWMVKDVPIGEFISAWYIGSLMGALCLMYLAARKGKDKKVFGTGELTRKDIMYLSLVSVAITASLASIYWSHFLAPQVLLFPIYMLGDKIIPIVIGFLIFKESRKYSREQLVYLAMGIVGGALLVISVK